MELQTNRPVNNQEAVIHQLHSLFPIARTQDL